MPGVRVTSERGLVRHRDRECRCLEPPRSMTARQWILWRFVEHVSPRLPRVILCCALGGALLLSGGRCGDGVLVVVVRAIADALK